jgi:hypothetical protein
MNADDLPPPWETCPGIPAGDIGWRMGRGEEVYDEFYRYFSCLTDEEAAEYSSKHPEPRGWRGKYAQIRANPWK